MNVEEFVAQRRSDQEEWAERFLPFAQEAISGGNVLEQITELLEELWTDETELPAPDFAPLLEQIDSTFSLLTDESSAEATALWMSVAGLNFTSHSSAFAQGLGLEWRTMRDSDVREIHREAEGQQIRAGELFEVGGEQLPYPGWPGARPDNYLNCRCVARPISLTEDANLSAGGPMTVTEQVEEAATETGRTWFGILAPEGKPSGDGRMFAAGALRNRDLPLPLTWQKMSDEGHKSSVTVAKITRLQRVGDEIRAEGEFLDTPEAEEAMSLIREFGRYGVSIDADEAVIGESAEEGVTLFSDARIAGASIVSIPAFAEAFVSLGEAPPQFFEHTTGECDEYDEEGNCVEEAEEEFRDVSQDERDRLAEEGKALPDGSYPIANCDDLRNAVQAIGRAKDREATIAHIKKRANDLDCPDFELPEGWAAEVIEAGSESPMTPALSLIASGWSDIDSKMFDRPDFIRGGANIVGDHAFGYIAEWGVCHITYPGACVNAPRSEHDYAFFSTGSITCSDGKVVNVGSLTVDTGHAAHNLNARAAAAHYDNTGAVWAYVAVGEDERGIWFSGIVSPTATEDQLRQVQASGRVSGDWRMIGGNLELVAALSVNVAGFPKVAAGLDATGQVSLVAAGASSSDSDDAAEKIANRVVEKIESRVQARKEREERLKNLRSRLGEEEK